ncbi:MAG: hypothetical protein FJ146_11515 [Deltaproteobacteria bacterium]|nr:hypothetical protein [Deltaproteobacteria bacterium]
MTTRLSGKASDQMRDTCLRVGRPDAGFTLVGAIVMVAFLGIFAYVIFAVVNNSMTVRRIVETSSTYKDIDSAFKAALVDELHRLLNPTTGTCAGAPLVISGRDIGGDGAKFKTSNAISPWPAGAPARHVAAIQRCRNGFRSPPSKDDYYFCVEFSGINNNSFAANSFNGAPKAMAEVRARVISLDNGLPLGSVPSALCPAGAVPSPFCCAYKNGFHAGLEKSGSSSLEIQYSLYWQSRGKPILFKSTNGSFYAPSFN